MSSGLPANTSTPCRESPEKKNQCDKTSFISSREPRNRSRSVDALISARRNSTVLEHSKTNQKDRSPFGEKFDAVLASPPERGQVTRSASKILHKMNSPSPEKPSTPTNREKEVPESSSLKSLSKNESYGSKIRLRESNIIDAEESKSDIVEESFISFQDEVPSNLSDPDSLAKHSNPDGLHLPGSVLNLPEDKHVSTVCLNALTDSSTSSNLDSGKSEDLQSASNVSAESVLQNLPSEESKTALLPETSTSKENEILSVILFEAYQPDIPVKELLHTSKVNDRASGSEVEPTSKHRNSMIGDCESCLKTEKNDYSSVSPKDTLSALNLSVTKNNAQNLKSPQSCPMFLNPYLPLSSSKIVDSGIETRKLNRSVIFNPHLPSSCHLPLRNYPPVVNVRHAVLKKFDNFDKKAKINQKPSDLSFRAFTPNRDSRHQLQEFPISSQGSLLNSVSDEILISEKSSEDQAQCNSPLGSQSKGASVSRNPSETMREMNETSRVIQPLFGRILPRPALNRTLASRDMHKIQTELSRSNQLLKGMSEIPSSDEASNARHMPEIFLQQNYSYPISKESLTRSTSSEPPRSRSSVGSGTNSPDIDALEEAFTSGHQPLVKDDGDQCSSSHVPQSEKPCEQILGKIESSISSRANRYPEYAFEARVLLESVMKEIMLFNEESDQWIELSVLFNRVSESSSEMDRMNLCTELIWYLAQRGYDLWHQNLVEPLAMTAETYTLEAYEILTTVVVTLLASTLTVHSGWNLDRLFLSYESFRSLFDTFSQHSENDDVGYTEDGASRNDLTTLKKMIRRLLFAIQEAFQLIFIYIGENVEKEEIQVYVENVTDEDKKYLRRKSL